jgi:ATP-dependent DNA ligase
MTQVLTQIYAVKVFDLLYLNGQSLIHRSTRFRKRNLRACMTEVRGRLELVAEFEGRTAKDVRARMEEVMDARGEGLIVKHPDATYVLNGRNKDWIKVCGDWDGSNIYPHTVLKQVKPEYMVCELVVVGC